MTCPGERVYRLAVVAIRPQPYQAAFFRALGAHLQIKVARPLRRGEHGSFADVD